MYFDSFLFLSNETVYSSYDTLAILSYCLFYGCAAIAFAHKAAAVIDVMIVTDISFLSVKFNSLSLTSATIF